jgi:hypothetical protein
MYRSMLVSFFIGAFAFTTTSLATNSENGKKLYNKKCLGCHDSHIFTRPNRIVHTHEALGNRVEFCDSQIKSGFNSKDQADITDYLNDDYYKFLKL